VHVVTADPQAAIYLAPKDPVYPGFLDFYGCAYKAKRSYLFGPMPLIGGGPGNSEGVELEALAGVVAAVASVAGGIEVRDLLNGRVLHAVYGSTVGVGTPQALVVKGDGAVAWTMGLTLERTYRVYALDKTGLRVLASSSELNPFSLALAGSRLYWRQDGRTMSATLH
jgi:hypothetical protein